MKPTRELINLTLTLLVLTASANAQLPSEELLKQMVGQLQQSPNDSALRAKIIKLGAELKPAPAIPEEANRALVKGNVFKEAAKDAAGYDLAIASYRDALRAAPWWGDAYYNQAVTLGLAEKFDAAIASFKHYIASVPSGSAEARDAQNKIYALEAKAEIATAKMAEANKVAATKAAADKANDEATLIVPGERIGRIRIGMPMSQVEEMLGSPNGNYKYVSGAGHCNWNKFSVGYDERMRVYSIMTELPENKTSAGVGVGSLIDEARRAWGPPKKEQDGTQRNNEQGRFSTFADKTLVLVFWNLETRRVSSITIW